MVEEDGGDGECDAVYSGDCEGFADGSDGGWD